MGLTVHYSLKSAAHSSRRAQAIVDRMRELALDIPFEFVSDIIHLKGEEGEVDAGAEHDTAIAFLVRQAALPVKVPWAVKRIKRDFGTEQICTRCVEAAPLELFAFFVTPGPGCETARLGLARYPREVEVTYDPAEDVRFFDDNLTFSYSKWQRHLARQRRSTSDRPDDDIQTRRLSTRVTRWRWGSFCKTQYASDPKCGGPANFLRCHIGLITLLDRLAALAGLKVGVYDEGKYGRHRSRADASDENSVSRWRSGNYDPRTLLAELGHWNELIAAGMGALKDVFGSDVAGPILNYSDFERLEFKGRGKFDVDSFLDTMKDLTDHARRSHHN